MTQDTYDVKKVEYPFSSGLSLAIVLASGDSQKIKHYLKEKEIPQSSVEILNFILNNNIPFESMSKMDRIAGLERAGRYGNQLAMSTKSLIESLPRRDANGELDKSSQKVFGIDYLDLENTFYDYSISHQSFINLSYEEREAFIQKKINEFTKNPENFYPGVKKLLDPSIRSLNSELPNGMSEGAKLYLFLYSQVFYPIEKTGEYADCDTFEIPNKVTSYYFCKDSEFYFNSRIDVKNTGRETSPDRTVFHRNGKPILLQKTGGYKTEFGDKGSTNATALNLEPIFVSGILYPPGTLFGVVKKGDPGYVKKKGNQSFDISEIEGLVPLRLSIYSISPDAKQREDAFGVHYKDFKGAIQNEEGSLEIFKKIAKTVTEEVSTPTPTIQYFSNPYSS